MGTYDPTLDAQGRGLQRSYDDLLQNFNIDKTRATDDLKLALADTATSQQRLNQDHATALANINRNYGDLAVRQAEGALKANVESPGLLARALARRQANARLDTQGVDTSFNRATEDTTKHTDALKLAFDRAFGPSGDNVVNLSRAGRDLVAGQSDLNAQRWYAATANGYVPAPRIPRRKTRRQVIV